MILAESVPTMDVELLITGGRVVTMDAERRVFADGAVAIADGRIARVGPSSEVMRAVRPGRIIDAARKVVLPGFIDAHAHAGHSLTKGIGAHLPTEEWARLLNHVHFQATTVGYWYADGLLSGVERLRFGTTTAVMMLGSQPRTDRPDYGEAFARGAAESGVRTLVSVGPPGPPWPKRFTDWGTGTPRARDVTYQECLAVTEELVRRWTAANDGRTGVMVGPARFSVPSRHDLFFDEAYAGHATREAADVRDLAEKYGVYIHTHAYGEGIQHFHDHLPGLLGEDVLLVHCTGLSPREVEILAEAKAKVAYCPTARRPYIGPRCPVPELMDAGVTLAVATDASAPDRSFDLFETIRTAQRLQRAHFTDPHYLPPGKMLETVTIDAAKAIGRSGEIGSLEVGKRADLILVDSFRPHMVPSLLPISQLVHSSMGADVTNVFVDGEQVLAAGRFITIRENDVMGLAEAEARSMVSRAGIHTLLEQEGLFWGRSRT